MGARPQHPDKRLAPAAGFDRRDLAWLAMMSLALFLLLLPISSYVAALPYIQQEWGLNNTQAAVVYSAYLAGYALSALLVVPLTDRIGARPIFIGSAVLSLVAHLLFPLLADGLVTAVFLRTLAGVGLVGVYVPGLRIVAERFADGGRGTAMGLYVTAQYAANGGSLAITGALLASRERLPLGLAEEIVGDAGAWREAYLLLALAAVVGLPIAYMLLRRYRAGDERASSGRLDLSVLKIRPIRYLILGYSLHALQLFTVRVWLPVFLVGVLVARGAENAQALGATLAGVALTIGAVGPFMGGLMSDRWGRAASASAIFALSGACSWMIGWTGDFPWAIIVGLSVVYGWAIAADSAIYSSGITDESRSAQLGSTMAVQASLGLLGGVLGPIAFGGILDIVPETYRWGLAFSALGIVAVVAIAGLQRLRSMPESGAVTRGRPGAPQ